MQHNILNRLVEASNLDGQPFPGMSIIEIIDDCRVLIENHYGVAEYTYTQIRINVCFGQVLICGCGMELKRMTKDQIIIRGEIKGVTLLKGKKHG